MNPFTMSTFSQIHCKVLLQASWDFTQLLTPLLQTCNKVPVGILTRGNYIQWFEFDRNWISDVCECNELHIHSEKHYPNQGKICTHKNTTFALREWWLKEIQGYSVTQFLGLQYIRDKIKPFFPKEWFFLITKLNSLSAPIFVLCRERATASGWGGEQLHRVLHRGPPRSATQQSPPTETAENSQPEPFHRHRPHAHGNCGGYLQKAWAPAVSGDSQWVSSWQSSEHFYFALFCEWMNKGTSPMCLQGSKRSQTRNEIGACRVLYVILLPQILSVFSFRWGKNKYKIICFDFHYHSVFSRGRSAKQYCLQRTYCFETFS